MSFITHTVDGTDSMTSQQSQKVNILNTRSPMEGGSLSPGDMVNVLEDNRSGVPSKYSRDVKVAYVVKATEQVSRAAIFNSVVICLWVIFV
jgi:hypothetical protein